MWFFGSDYLLQYLLYVCGIYFEYHGKDLLIESNLHLAKRYYEDSISCPMIERVEQRLMLRALCSLQRIARKVGLTMTEYSLKLEALSLKFRPQRKVVQVIMELCNEDIYSHEVIFNFIRFQVSSQRPNRCSFSRNWRVATIFPSLP